MTESRVSRILGFKSVTGCLGAPQTGDDGRVREVELGGRVSRGRSVQLEEREGRTLCLPLTTLTLHEDGVQET